MLKTMFLTEEFYKAHENCPEIEQKENRPYIQIRIMIDGVLWGIPLRSHINHSHAIWTDKENGCGIDFTKAVVIKRPDQYISNIQPHIRPDEFKVLKRLDEYRVVQKFQKYIKDYQKAKQHPEVPRNKRLVEFSTLQYFEDFI